MESPESTPDIREAARTRIMAARIIAQRKWPYLSTLLFSLRLVETDGIQVPTMAVDAGWRVYYNPNFVMSMTPIELSTVLLHEAMHCVLQHNARFEALSTHQALSRESGELEFHHKLFNLAGDCSINETLDQANVVWPESSPPVMYRDFHEAGVKPGEITETTYRKLVDQYVDTHSDPEETSDGEACDSQACDGASCDGGHAGECGDGGEAIDNSGARAVAPISTIDCGSASGGPSRIYELAHDDEDHPRATLSEQEIVLDKTASEVSASAARGFVPAGLARWADGYLEPTINWRRQLAVKLRSRIASVAGRRDYSYLRPSRRQEAMRLTGSTVLLPAMRQPAPPRIAIVADTSGSISAEEITQYLGEISGMIRAVGVRDGISVISCDAQAYEPINMRSIGDLTNIRFKGGGGTNMCAGIEAALELKPTPHIVVVLTDGLTPWPQTEPMVDVHFIVATTRYNTMINVPAWMHAIFIDSD